MSGSDAKISAPLPEIRVDFNALWSERGYAVLPATLESLAQLGLTLERAVGCRFLLNGGDDADDEGYLADILHVGTIVVDERFGHLAETDKASDFFWRRKGPLIA